MGGKVATGLLLALATSGGIVGERISEGAPDVAVVVNLLVTTVAVMVLALTSRELRAASMVAQAVGAAAGVALVHYAVRQCIVVDIPWLSERPSQLVNDAAAASATLILIWACAKKLDARVFAVALMLVTLYRATALHWHVDHAPHAFHTTIQQLVAMQFAACSLGLLLFTYVTRRRELS